MSAPVLAAHFFTYICPPDHEREVCPRCCERIADDAEVRVSLLWTRPANEPPALEHANGCEPALLLITGRAGRSLAPVERGNRAAKTPPLPTGNPPSPALAPGRFSRFLQRLRETLKEAHGPQGD